MQVGSCGDGTLPVAVHTAADGADIEVVGGIVVKTGDRHCVGIGDNRIGHNRVGIYSRSAIHHLPTAGQAVLPCKAHLTRSSTCYVKSLRDAAATHLADGDVVDIGVAIVAAQTSIDDIACVGRVQVGKRHRIFLPRFRHGHCVDPYGMGYRVEVGHISHHHGMGVVGGAGAATPEFGLDSVDGLLDAGRCKGAVDSVVVGVNIHAIAATPCLKDTPAAGELAAVGVEILHQREYRGAAVGAETEIGAVTGVAGGTDVVESATIIGVGVEAGESISGVIGIVPSAVLLKVEGIVAAGGSGRPAEGGIVRVYRHHRRGAGHIEAGGSQPYLYIVDVNRTVVA